jgi:hypothetical protein
MAIWPELNDSCKSSAKPSATTRWGERASRDDSKAILVDKALPLSLWVSRSGDRAAEYLNVDPNGMAAAGYGNGVTGIPITALRTHP